MSKRIITLLTSQTVEELKQESRTLDEDVVKDDYDDEDDDRSIDIEELDEERIESDNDDQEMVDADKTNKEKAEEEKADEEHKGDEQVEDDQAKDDVLGALVSVTPKEKPDLQLSTSSHSLSSNYGNQFLNVSSDISLIAPLLDVLVSVIPLHTTTTPTQLITPLTTPLPTPPIISEASLVTTIHDPLPVVIKRLSVLEQEVKELKQVNHPELITASIRIQVPSTVNKYLGSSLGDILLENEYKQKDIMFKMMTATKSYEKHPSHKSLYDALIQSLFVDEDNMDRAFVDPPIQTKRKNDDKDQDPFARLDQGKEKKRQRTKEFEPAKKYSTSKDSSKGKTPSNTSKTSKSVTIVETVKEHVHAMTMDVEELDLDNVVDDVNLDQPQADADPNST
ncbi:hypothetical protein Tco_0260947 [Tanacetum coccineum]